MTDRRSGSTWSWSMDVWMHTNMTYGCIQNIAWSMTCLKYNLGIFCGNLVRTKRQPCLLLKFILSQPLCFNKMHNLMGMLVVCHCWALQMYTCSHACVWKLWSICEWLQFLPDVLVSSYGYILILQNNNLHLQTEEDDHAEVWPRKNQVNLSRLVLNFLWVESDIALQVLEFCTTTACTALSYVVN